MKMKMPITSLRYAEATPAPRTTTTGDAPTKQFVWQMGRARPQPFFRWWTHLTRVERIVTMSLAVGGLVAIVNSLTWAIATSYMARQKAQAQLAAKSVETATLLMEHEREATPAMR